MTPERVNDLKVLVLEVLSKGDESFVLDDETYGLAVDIALKIEAAGYRDADAIEAIEDRTQYLRKLCDSLQDELDDHPGASVAELSTSDVAIEATWKALDFTVDRGTVVKALRVGEIAAAHVAQRDDSEAHPYKVLCLCGAWNYDHRAHVDRVLAGV